MKRFILLILVLLGGISSYAAGITISMANLSGMEVTVRNIFDFDVVSSYQTTKNVKVKGQLRFRNSRHIISYTTDVVIQPGINKMSGRSIRLQYTSSDLKRLFESGTMPFGAYDYCVTVIETSQGNEQQGDLKMEECVFGNNDNVFLLELDYPEDNAKIKEFHPNLIWIVNSPYAGQIKYRVKVAEIHPKQNKLTAIQRNNFVLDYKYHPVNSMMYPASGRPLKAGQPYAWTVDAYYNDILLGTAAPWQFTIVEDSIPKTVSLSRSYYDFAGSRNPIELQVNDTVKLKYNNTGSVTEISYAVIQSENGMDKVVYEDKMRYQVGWNYVDLSLKKSKLKHLQVYTIRFKVNSTAYDIPFRYHNLNKEY